MFRMHLLGVQEGDSMSYMDTYRQWCENPYFDESVREELKSIDPKSTRLNSSHGAKSRMPSSA